MNDLEIIEIDKLENIEQSHHKIIVAAKQNKSILLVDKEFGSIEISEQKVKDCFAKLTIIFESSLRPISIFMDEMKDLDKRLMNYPKEKHFEKFNYKMKRGKKKWR